MSILHAHFYDQSLTKELVKERGRVIKSHNVIHLHCTKIKCNNALGPEFDLI